jgi:flagellar biosynthesis protein
MDEKAVALHYDPNNPKVPTIVATGKGAVADEILRLAFANGVKVRQDADLVAMLSVLELGASIPVAAFAAVAEIMSYIYRNANSSPGDAVFPPDPPGTERPETRHPETQRQREPS